MHPPGQLAGKDALLGGQLLQGDTVPVAAHEQDAIFRGKRAKPTLDELGQLFFFQRLLGGLRSGNAFLQFVEQRRHPGISLLGVVFIPEIDGGVADDPAQPRPEADGALGRDGVAHLMVGVVDALLGILPDGQDAAGDGKTKGTVFLCGFGDGLLVSLPIQVDDPAVFHGVPSFPWDCSLHLYRQVLRRDIFLLQKAIHRVL